MRCTDHKNETRSKARRPRRVQIYLSHENRLHKVHMHDSKDGIAVGELYNKTFFLHINDIIQES